MNKNRSDELVWNVISGIWKVLETISSKLNQMVTQIEPGILSTVCFQDTLEATAFFIEETEN